MPPSNLLEFYSDNKNKEDEAYTPTLTYGASDVTDTTVRHDDFQHHSIPHNSDVAPETNLDAHHIDDIQNPLRSGTSVGRQGSPRTHRCLLPNCKYPDDGPKHDPEPWVKHVLTHFQILPKRPGDDENWIYSINCGLCAVPYDFRYLSWRDITQHIYDIHIQPEDDLRTVHCISPQLSSYLEYAEVMPKGSGSYATEVADNPGKWNQDSEKRYPPRSHSLSPSRRVLNFSDNQHAVLHMGGFFEDGVQI